MKSILIVDDESRLLQSIQAGLKSCQDKFSVLTALNGREAIDVLAGQQVDLVVTDLRMPEVDGFELLAHISQIYPFLPTIVMTAFATPEIEERISSAGSFVLLEKPLDFDRLAEAIGDGLEQSATDGTMVGISLASFMQLPAMEQKTRLLQIQADSGEEGFMFFDGGDLTAAVAREAKGEEAVYRMLALDNVKLTFRKTPTKKVRRQIFHQRVGHQARRDRSPGQRRVAEGPEGLGPDECRSRAGGPCGCAQGPCHRQVPQRVGGLCRHRGGQGPSAHGSDPEQGWQSGDGEDQAGIGHP